MRRLPTLCLLALAPLTGMAPQAQAASLYNLLVGTYTEGSSEGIQVYRFDGTDGSVKGPLRVAPYQQPLVPDLRPGPTHSVRGQRERTGRQGRYRRSRHVLPFRSDQRPPATDQPGPDPRRSSDLQQPQPRRSLPVRRQLLGTAGRFGGGTAGARGRLAGTGGAGGVAPGQQGASAPGFRSCALGGVLARRPVPVRPDLGADKVFVYRYAPEQAERPLQAADPAFVPTPPGSGPRHLIFSADGRFAYLTLELSGQVMVFAHEGNGRLRQLQTHDLAPAGFQGKVGAGALHLSADGRFLGVLNRGDDNQLVTFAVDPASGQLRFVERRSVEGTEPREFAFARRALRPRGQPEQRPVAGVRPRSAERPGGQDAAKRRGGVTERSALRGGAVTLRSAIRRYAAGPADRR